MNIIEKLRRLTETQNKAGIARKAGLKPTQLNDYTSKGFKPRYDIALRIGRAMGVSVEWLLDDAAEWPPPPMNAAPTPDSLSDRELMIEVAKRHRREILSILDALNSAEQTDWAAARETLSAWRVGDPIPNALAQSLSGILESLHPSAELRYSPAYFSLQNHALMPGKDRLVSDFNPARINERFHALEGNEHLKWIGQRIAAAPENARKNIMVFRDGSAWAKPPEAEEKIEQIAEMKARLRAAEERFKKDTGMTAEDFIKKSNAPATAPPPPPPPPDPPAPSTPVETIRNRKPPPRRPATNHPKSQ